MIAGLRCLGRSGLAPDEVTQVVESSSFGPLTSALRRAEATGNDVDRLLAKVVASRSIADAVDIGAVLHKRIRFAAGGRRLGRSDLIAGLIPAARGEMADDHRAALAERERIMERRSVMLAAEAIEAGAAWTRGLGDVPSDPVERDRWMAEVATVAAYRDRYGVAGRSPLGTPPRSDAQRTDAYVARAALRRAVSRTRSVAPAPSNNGVQRALLGG